MLAGDGRCDSPGASAKFCSYSLMELDSGQILHVETVDKREVQLRSPNMEHEAFLRSLKFIKGKLTYNELVTDASSSIRKTIGTKMFNCSVLLYVYLLHTQPLNIQPSFTPLMYGIRPRN